MANLSEGQHTGEFIISELDDSQQGQYSRENVTYTVSNLKAGHVVGAKLTGATYAAAVAQAGNTGNGTVNAPTAGATANVRPPQLGNYSVVFESATQFVVFDPSGIDIGHGVTGTAFTNHINFTITAGGTAFVPGDAFTILVTLGTGAFKYLEYNPTNTDGSQFAAGVSYSNYDASVMDKAGVLIARAAVVRASDLIWFTGATAAQKTEGQRQLALLTIISR